MEIADTNMWLYVSKSPISDWNNKYTKDDIINMFEFRVDIIFVVLEGKVFQQILGKTSYLLCNDKGYKQWQEKGKRPMVIEIRKCIDQCIWNM